MQTIPAKIAFVAPCGTKGMASQNTTCMVTMTTPGQTRRRTSGGLTAWLVVIDWPDGRAGLIVQYFCELRSYEVFRTEMAMASQAAVRHANPMKQGMTASARLAATAG